LAERYGSDVNKAWSDHQAARAGIRARRCASAMATLSILV